MQGTEVCRLVEGAKAEVYTVAIILAIVLVYTDSHDTMAIMHCVNSALAPSTNLQTSVLCFSQQLHLPEAGRRVNISISSDNCSYEKHNMV
jgi:hypothetical protein